MAKKTTWVKKRHNVIYAILRILVTPFMKIMYHYKAKKYKLNKKQAYLILSNHQALLDPIFVAMSFKRPIYFVATDNLFTHKFISKLLKYCFAPIPKRKATIDAICLKNCFRVTKEKGTVCIFVEGNRAYNDFQFYIDPSICKLIRRMELPLILYNLKGGYGVDPRWGKGRRKGKFVGEVNKVLSVEEINALSDEELYTKVCENLKVIDSNSNNLYKSKERAEYLERQLFICPKCGKMQTLYTTGNYIYCKECDLKAEYLENLKIKVNDENIKFEKLLDWYKYQLDYIKQYDFDDEKIFEDDEVELYISNTNQPRKLIAEGKLYLTKDKIQCDDYIITVKDIISASPIGGFKFIITTMDNNYIVKGNARFNPIKYVLLFNKLDGPIKERGGDKYYGLDINNI